MPVYEISYFDRKLYDINMIHKPAAVRVSVVVDGRVHRSTFHVIQPSLHLDTSLMAFEVATCCNQRSLLTER